MATAKAAENCLLVAAVDIGTASSGFAFSFKDEFIRDPMKISTKNWPSHGFCKAPTALLLTKDKKFDSFGFDAEEKYCKLVDDNKQGGWYFFRRFKMLLHKESLKKTTLVKDEEGKQLPAIDVFCHCIWSLKETLLEEIERSCPALNLSDISWVITVPAIWNDAAKQLMRMAAIKAGIEDKKLMLALEPEAAALYCRLIPTKRMTLTSGIDILAGFQAGYRYLIADLGGGTADITAHEVAKDFSLKEIHQADGGSWGGVQVEEKFLEFLNELFEDRVIREWREENQSDFLDLTRDFESRKKRLGEKRTTQITLDIPVSLTKIVEKKKLSLQDVIEKSNYKMTINVRQNKIRIDKSVIEGFFQETVDNIGSYIKKIITNKNCSNIQMILMVGGFSESAFVRESMHKRFPNIRIVVPQDAGMSVLNGAVLFGHDPNVIAERVCRRTYGIALHYPFEDRKHPDDKLVEIDGDRLCKDCFETFVNKGDSIRLGEVKSQEFHETFKSKDRKHITEYVKVYTSDSKSPKYVTDKSCTLVGQGIEIKPPNGGWPDSIEGKIEMLFGGTEFKVKLTDEKTNIEYPAKFDFLG